MKVILKFNLPEDQQEFQEAMNGSKLAAAYEEVANEVFRPARKHGYRNAYLQELIDKNPDAIEIISILEKMYFDIMEN